MKRCIAIFGMLTLVASVAAAAAVQEKLEMSGISTFAAYATRTGELVSDPTMNQCAAGCEFTILSRSSAKLVTTERCTINEELTFVREIVWGRVSLKRDGSVKLEVPRYVTTWNDVGGTREDVQEIEFVPTVVEHTGCRPYGSIPVYMGGFDGKNLYFSTHMHDICDGGNLWADMLGVSDELGPLAVTFGFALQAE